MHAFELGEQAILGLSLLSPIINFIVHSNSSPSLAIILNVKLVKLFILVYF